MASTIGQPAGSPAQEFNPNQVGYKFVKQYYETLSKEPSKLHRFYSAEKSMFSHGNEGDTLAPIIGQEEIHTRIMALEMEACKTEIKQVDCQSGPDDSILIQVIGWLSKNGSTPMRKFCQTFCLQKDVGSLPGKPMRFSICNDIFRYMKEVPSGVSEPVEAPNGTSHAEKVDTAPIPDINETVSAPEDAPVEPEPEPPVENLLPPADPEPAAVEAPAPVAAPIEPPKPKPIEPPVQNAVETVTDSVEPQKAEKKVFSYALAAGKPSSRSTPAPIAPQSKVVAPPAPTAPTAPTATIDSTVKERKSKEEVNGQLHAPAAVEPKTDNDEDEGFTTPHSKSSGYSKHKVSVYVRGLPSECEPKDLKALFERFGPIRNHPKFGLSIHIINQKQSRPGQAPGKYAFVEFEQVESFKKCLSEAEESNGFELLGRRVYVQERTPSRFTEGRGRGERGGRGGRGRGDARGRGRGRISNN